MNKFFVSRLRFTLLVTVVIVPLCALLLFACGGHQKQSNPQDTKVPITAFMLDCQSLSTNVTATVIAQNEQFIPHTVTVPVKGVVKWTNVGSATDWSDYWIISDTASFSTTTSIRHGESVCFQFDSAGTYNYHCDANVSGTVIVQ